MNLPEISSGNINISKKNLRYYLSFLFSHFNAQKYIWQLLKTKRKKIARKGKCVETSGPRMNRLIFFKSQFFRGSQQKLIVESERLRTHRVDARRWHFGDVRRLGAQAPRCGGTPRCEELTRVLHRTAHTAHQLINEPRAWISADLQVQPRGRADSYGAAATT